MVAKGANKRAAECEQWSVMGGQQPDKLRALDCTDAGSAEEHTYRYGKATDERKVDAARPRENARVEVICEEDSLGAIALLVEDTTTSMAVFELIYIHMPVVRYC